MFCKKTKVKIQSLWEKFIKCESIVDELINNNDKQVLEMIEIVKIFCNREDELISIIRPNGNTDEAIQEIDIISCIMILLQPLVSNLGAC